MQQQQQQLLHQPQYRTQGARVEEVAHHNQQRSSGSSSGPIVEEPDDEDNDDGAQQQAQEQYQVQEQLYDNQTHNTVGMPLQDPFGGLFGNLFAGMPGVNMSMSGNGGGQVYSYSSSTVYSSGAGGTYHSSTTSRQGPGGVRETQHTVRDGRTGHQSMTISRGLGDRERTVSRSRDATGQITSNERNRNLDPTAAETFDQQWVQHAQHGLPAWMNPSGGSRAQQVQGSGQSRQLLALPSTDMHGTGYQHQQQPYGAAVGGTGYGMQQQGASNTSPRWRGGYHV
eukprot:GHRR01002986.1.p1 GENE.GHRR01002986.1~~GHRR01002986.1.p1  ORF type:complete len:283 (+),score=106.21 GHRR01002986.1:1517-2365(+)